MFPSSLPPTARVALFQAKKMLNVDHVTASAGGDPQQPTGTGIVVAADTPQLTHIEHLLPDICDTPNFWDRICFHCSRFASLFTGGANLDGQVRALAALLSGNVEQIGDIDGLAEGFRNTFGDDVGDRLSVQIEAAQILSGKGPLAEKLFEGINDALDVVDPNEDRTAGEIIIVNIMPGHGENFPLAKDGSNLLQLLHIEERFIIIKDENKLAAVKSAIVSMCRLVNVASKGNTHKPGTYRLQGFARLYGANKREFEKRLAKFIGGFSIVKNLPRESSQRVTNAVLWTFIDHLSSGRRASEFNSPANVSRIRAEYDLTDDGIAEIFSAVQRFTFNGQLIDECIDGQGAAVSDEHRFGVLKSSLFAFENSVAKLGGGDK
ncbi:MAG: hypothetical protein LBB38_03710 [Puniceicoccales bacterium]|nr:hypothetical protein [Puniceicoccales bacterium]